MGPDIVVRGGASGAPNGSGSLHGRSDGGESGGELVQGLGECGSRVFDGEGNELHPSPVSSEGRQEGGVFPGLLLVLNVAAEIPAKADLDEDEGAFFLSKEVGSGGTCLGPLLHK